MTMYYPRNRYSRHSASLRVNRSLIMFSKVISVNQDRFRCHQTLFHINSPSFYYIGSAEVTNTPTSATVRASAQRLRPARQTHRVAAPMPPARARALHASLACPLGKRTEDLREPILLVLYFRPWHGNYLVILKRSTKLCSDQNLILPSRQSPLYRGRGLCPAGPAARHAPLCHIRKETAREHSRLLQGIS